MDFGVFQFCNYQDALYVRHIINGLAPTLRITDVPSDYDEQDIIARLKEQSLGDEPMEFEPKHHGYTVLPRTEWPDDKMKFGMTMSFAVL